MCLLLKYLFHGCVYFLFFLPVLLDTLYVKVLISNDLHFSLVKASLCCLIETNGGDWGKYSQVHELRVELEG